MARYLRGLSPADCGRLLRQAWKACSTLRLASLGWTAEAAVPTRSHIITAADMTTAVVPAQSQFLVAVARGAD